MYELLTVQSTVNTRLTEMSTQTRSSCRQQSGLANSRPPKDATEVLVVYCMPHYLSKMTVLSTVSARARRLNREIPFPKLVKA